MSAGADANAMLDGKIQEVRDASKALATLVYGPNGLMHTFDQSSVSRFNFALKIGCSEEEVTKMEATWDTYEFNTVIRTMYEENLWRDNMEEVVNDNVKELMSLKRKRDDAGKTKEGEGGK